MLEWEGNRSVKAALDWFLGFIEPPIWENKKEEIKQHLRDLLKAQNTSKLPPLEAESTRFLYPHDVFFWYLFLAHAYNNDVEYYEFSQGARVIPLFSIIGQHLNLLKEAHGVEDLIQRMLTTEKENPDSAIFELLVGLLYLRNYWKKVTFLEPSRIDKTPDILAESPTRSYYVECKRLSKSSLYSDNERKIWLKMSQPLRQYLIDTRRPFIIDIVFHEELTALDTKIIENVLLPKLDFVAVKCTIVDNDIWTVTVDLVDLQKIRNHMRNFRVKASSSALIDLIFNQYEPARGYSPVLHCRRRGSYLDDINFAAGAVWSCDAENAIDIKSRHIHRQIAEACSQLPDGKPGNVHVGLESHDGYFVEQVRFHKIMEHIAAFEARGKLMHWVYCHIFDPRTPRDENWNFGETVLLFKSRDAGIEPLPHCAVALPDDSKQRNGVFWDEG